MKQITINQDDTFIGEGVEFSDGSVAIRTSGSTSIWSNVDEVRKTGVNVVYTDAVPEVWDGGTP